MHLKPSVPTQRVCILPRSLLLGPPTLGVVPSHVAAEAAGRPETHATDVAYLAVADAVNHLLRTGEAIGPFSSRCHAAVESPQPRVDSTRKAGIHALGENESDLLAAYEPDEDTTLRLQRQAASVAAASGHVVVLGSANTSGVTIQPSLTQVAFKLSSVFDPSSAADAALFDLDDGSETDTALSSAASEENLLGANARLENDMALDPEDLDAELDALLGGDEAFWNASEALKKRWRSRDAASATKTAEDIWAVHDNVDVTDFGSLVPDPALQYPFDLDVFQRRAIFRLERNENVFVAAHTSAGKTVVAEYAIAMAQRNRTKVIYTSPIKTLSNQKFRDFTDRFGDVGLITGDVSLNPEAGVLVMTTEILRSMLYRGADIIRDLEFVIFDEVHWASDPERGVVWEESIILLPESCGIVMLSATVPNAIEFANWVGRTKRRSVYVVSTMKRPVPLVHSLFVKSEPYPLYDTNKGQFMHVNYKAAAEKQAAISRNSNVRFGGGRHHAWIPLIKYLRKHELDPAIIFCFSKRKCEEAADSLYSTDLTAGASEKNQIHHFYQTSIARLSPADQRVPQIARCLDSLKRGIGVHHAGILPIVKEVTEVLFQRGLVRVLFCTETFAVGVNAPARSVVFSAIRKWDGTSQRMLEAGEYVQMAGRAGRRGKDTVGTVLLYTAPADFPSENEVKQLLTGAHKRMKSQFRLTYNMILNLMRVDELRVEDVMSRSFSEAPAGRDSSRWKKLVANGEKQLKGLDRRGHELDRFRDLHQLSLRVRALNESLALLLSNMKKLASSAAFQTGRVLIVDRGDGGFAIACITKSVMTRTAKLGLRAASSPASTSGSGDKLCRVAVLLGGPATASSSSPFYAMQGSSVGTFGDYTFNVGGVRLAITDVPSARVHAFTSLVVSLNEQGMNPLRGDPKAEALSSTAELLQEVANNSSYWTAMPLMEVSDIALKDLNESALWSERNELVRCMCEMFTRLSAVAGTRDLAEAMHELDREIALRRKVNELQMAASDESLQLMPDFRQRVEVLKRLGYADGGRVLLKGRAMCEVNCCELILVELCFENVLQRMGAAPMAALLSALVFQGRSGGNAEDDSKALERLRDASVELYDAAVAVRRILMSIGGVQAECGLPVSPLDYAVNQANFGLSEAVLTWAQGRPFTEVCCIVPDVAEGTIVRGIVRLSELLREVKNVGRIIGDMVLQDLADEATNAVKRDVIFAASLYVT